MASLSIGTDDNKNNNIIDQILDTIWYSTGNIIYNISKAIFNTIIEIGEVVSNPLTPDPGQLQLYAKTDDLLYTKNSTGQEIIVGDYNSFFSVMAVFAGNIDNINLRYLRYTTRSSRNTTGNINNADTYFITTANCYVISLSVLKVNDVDMTVNILVNQVIERTINYAADGSQTKVFDITPLMISKVDNIQISCQGTAIPGNVSTNLVTSRVGTNPLNSESKTYYKRVCNIVSKFDTIKRAMENEEKDIQVEEKDNEKKMVPIVNGPSYDEYPTNGGVYTLGYDQSLETVNFNSVVEIVSTNFAAIVGKTYIINNIGNIDISLTNIEDGFGFNIVKVSGIGDTITILNDGVYSINGIFGNYILDDHAFTEYHILRMGNGICVT